MHLLDVSAEIFEREFWAMFGFYSLLYPLEKIISVGLFLKEEVPLNGRLWEMGLLIQLYPKTLSVLVQILYDLDAYKSSFSASMHIYGVLYF